MPFLRVDGDLQPAPFDVLTPPTPRRSRVAIMGEHKRREFETTNEADVGYTLHGRGAVPDQRLPAARSGGPGDPPGAQRDPDVRGAPAATGDARRSRTARAGWCSITGPTGTGKTTTIASMIGHINRTRRAHIVTIEDPIEVVHDDELSIIQQREVGIDTESYAAALKHVVRQDPDVIFVGEIRDAESALSAIQAAETGHLVISTLHTIDCDGDDQPRPRPVPAPAAEGGPHVVRRARCAASCRSGSSRGPTARAACPAVEVLVQRARLRPDHRPGRPIDRRRDRRGQYYGMQTFDQALELVGRSGDRGGRADGTSQPHDFDLRCVKRRRGGPGASELARLTRRAPSRPLEGVPRVAERCREAERMTTVRILARGARGAVARPAAEHEADVIARGHSSSQTAASVEVRPSIRPLEGEGPASSPRSVLGSVQRTPAGQHPAHASAARTPVSSRHGRPPPSSAP